MNMILSTSKYMLCLYCTKYIDGRFSQQMLSDAFEGSDEEYQQIFKAEDPEVIAYLKEAAKSREMEQSNFEESP